MPLGPRDQSTLVLHTGWDATELQNIQLIDGTTIDVVFAALSNVLAALNAELMGGLWGSLASFTDQPEVSYRVGVSNGMERHTEYGRPDETRADTEGHMLPSVKWDKALGWTWDYLEEARLDQIQADIADAVKDVRDRWRVQMLTRVLQRGDDSGAYDGLGSSGLSPGFATDEASTGVDFVPVSFGGISFDNTHEHYVGIAGGAYTNAVFEDAYDELREHGHEPPFDFLISNSDRTAVEDLSKFTPVSDPLVQLGLTQDRATVSDDYLGVIERFRVREEFGFPQYYGFGYKTYGQGSIRNPLRVRFGKGLTTPQVIAMQDPRNASMAHPLQYIMLRMQFAVGVGQDRTNGTPRYTNNTTWADGTPT